MRKTHPSRPPGTRIYPARPHIATWQPRRPVAFLVELGDMVSVGVQYREAATETAAVQLPYLAVVRVQERVAVHREAEEAVHGAA
ncbi:hypothetical protein GCM10009736_76650 [Actinomadura bangladeshensis]